MKNQNVGGIFDQMKMRRLNEENTQEPVVQEPVVQEPTVEEPTVEEPVVQEPVVQEPTVEEPTVEDSVNEENLDEAVKKVVRDGKVETKTVTTKKKRLSSAQKKALAQARKKAHTASANKARAKSMKKRASMNMEDTLVCPECGFEGTSEEFDEDEGVLYCPECGAEYTEASESCKKNEDTDVAELAVRLEECNGSSFMKKALNEGKYEMVQKYLEIKEGE